MRGMSREMSFDLPVSEVPLTRWGNFVLRPKFAVRLWSPALRVAFRARWACEGRRFSPLPLNHLLLSRQLKWKETTDETRRILRSDDLWRELEH